MFRQMALEYLDSLEAAPQLNTRGEKLRDWLRARYAGATIVFQGDGVSVLRVPL